MTKNIKNRGFALVPAILIVVAVLMIGGGAYYLLSSSETNSNYNSNEAKSSDSLTPPNENSNIGIRDWKVYGNEKYGFGFLHPKEVEISEIPGGGDILADIRLDSGINFQVYKQGFFQRSSIFSLSSEQASRCKVYNRSTKFYDGISSVEIEYQDCPSNKASPSTPLTFVTVVPFNKTDLVITRYDDPSYDIIDTLDLRKDSTRGMEQQTKTEPN